MKKILLNILTHGDELLGRRIADAVSVRYPEVLGNGLDIQIANERAYKEGKRYITHDLNRVFPGTAEGSYEERRAAELCSIISSYELVIDIHSTESGSGDMVIVTKLNTDTMQVLKHLAPRYVLHMAMKPDSSLISCAKRGVAFEMGSDADEASYAKTLAGVESLLCMYDLIKKVPSLGCETEFFEVSASVPKPAGARLKPHIRNFQRIGKGDVFAEESNGAPIVADHDFYPVIFGSTNYETIFGFEAQHRWLI